MLDLSDIAAKIQIAREQGKSPAFAYDRISDDVQADGLSLAYQASAAQRYADYMNLKIIHVFSAVESARKEGREAFNMMLDTALKLGIKDIIFKNTDRMARNYADGIIRLEKLIDHEDFNIHFYQNNRIINRQSNHNDRFILGIEIAVAKHLSDKISNDVKEANKYKAKNGIAPGRSPYGYRYDIQAKRHVINPATETNVRYIFNEFDSGTYSIDKFCRHLNTRGIFSPTGRSWDKQNLWQLLRSPFYHGEFRYHGAVFQGTHDRYYEKDRWQMRIDRISDKSKQTSGRSRDFALNGLLECSCGYTMYGDIVKGRYIYYIHKCPNAGGQVSLKEAECFSRIDAVMDRIRFTDAFADNLRGVFKAIVAEKNANRREELAQITTRITDIEAKKNRLIELYADGGIDRDAVKRKMDSYATVIDDLYRQRKIAETHGDSLFNAVADIIENVRDFVKHYHVANGEEKVALIKMMAERIKMDGAVTTVHFKKPFSFLLRPEFFEIPAEEFEFVGTMLPRQDKTRTFAHIVLEDLALWVAA